VKHLRHIVVYPDPVLRQRAKPVVKVDASVRALVEEMFLLMRAEEGAGLAAPQVCLCLDTAVTEKRLDCGEPERVFINPVLSGLAGELQEHDEGCLSLPEIRGNIRRQPAAVIEALDIEGKPFRVQSDQFIARVWQHEIDHLEGTLILDRMTVLDRLRVRRMVKNLEAEARG